jgi:hypothetical protein
MSFSASDWRNRMAYYDGYYTGYYWSGLGNAQSTRKYYLNPYVNGPNGINATYTQCGPGYNTPNVEPAYAYSSWGVYYTVYVYGYNFYYGNFYFSYGGTYNTGNWFSYIAQNSYDTNLGYTYVPSNYSYAYGTTSSYVQVDQYYYLGFGGVSAITATVYNYSYGPYLSYYRYSLSNGTYTNYPYQYRVPTSGGC